MQGWDHHRRLQRNFPEDHRLVDQHELLDVWVTLHGSTGSDGATRGVGVELEGGLKAGRLDKVIMSGLKLEA
jgi:tyrosyl-DNA phosphodiesterase 2